MPYAKSVTIAFVLAWTLLSCITGVCCQGDIIIGSDSASSSSSSSSSSSGGPVIGHDEQDAKFSSDKQGSKDDGKGGFQGGKPPKVRRCTTVPGCRVCPSGVCTACYYNYGGSRFILDAGICRCPPGFGDISGLNIPLNPYTSLQDADKALRTAQDNTEINSYNTTDDSFYDTDTTGTDSVHSTSVNPSSAGFPNLPVWAAACKPCPGGSFSLGGDIGTAECQLCDQGFTSLPASAGCTIRTDCTVGQQPNDRGNCVPCRIGSYQDTPSTGVCKPCPVDFTTVTTGSTSRDDCIVPVCPPGKQLQTFNTGPNVGLAYWCANCTGLGYSTGGRVWQGVDQPSCQDCVLPQVPTLDRTSCASNICPPPDAFEINCTAATAAGATQCPGPAVDPQVVFLPSLCTALPHGAVLSWYKATACTGDPPVCWYNFNKPLAPPLADCPITGIINTTVPSDAYGPYITSFNGRTDCLCPVGQINCNFVTGFNTQTNYKPFTTAAVAGNAIIIIN